MCKSRTLLLTILLSASLSTLAGNHTPPSVPAFTGSVRTESESSSTAISGSQSRSNADSSSQSNLNSSIQNEASNVATGGTGLGIAEGGDGGSAEASNNGNANVAVNSTYKAVRNAPSIALGSIYPTAGCQGGVGIGGSGVNGSGLLNFSFTKKECETVVLAQNFANIGMPETACDLLKTTKAYQRALRANPGIVAECDRPAPLPEPKIEQPVIVAPALDPRYATKEELDRVFRKTVSK